MARDGAALAEAAGGPARRRGGAQGNHFGHSRARFPHRDALDALDFGHPAILVLPDRHPRRGGGRPRAAPLLPGAAGAGALHGGAAAMHPCRRGAARHRGPPAVGAEGAPGRFAHSDAGQGARTAAVGAARHRASLAAAGAGGPLPVAGDALLW